MAVEIIDAWGHPKVRGTHRTTWAITKEASLTERGDCIIGVRASRAPADFSSTFRKILSRKDTKVTAFFEVGEIKEKVTGFGGAGLLLSHRLETVCRKSGFICPRTIMVMADKSAFELHRNMVAVLRDPGQRLRVTFVAEVE